MEVTRVALLRLERPLRAQGSADGLNGAKGRAGFQRILHGAHDPFKVGGPGCGVAALDCPQRLVAHLDTFILASEVFCDGGKILAVDKVVEHLGGGGEVVWRLDDRVIGGGDSGVRDDSVPHSNGLGS